ncbi:MAG: VCBS repeat-containing protein [Firmicutes bacterium]|nr:VCBS repeat-containing protein [Bacillota bacterium]
MDRIKMFFACMLCLAQCACGSGRAAVQTDTYTLDTASIPQNTQTIEKILGDNVWNYDADSLTFGNDLIISGEGENFALICAASAEAGIDTKRLEKGAKQTMLATVRLLNSDMSDAGTAYFAFSGKELLCGYYMYNNVCRSLTDKYPFEYAAPFAAVEKKDVSRSFSQVSSKPLFDSVQYISGGETAVLSGSAIVFYGSGENGLKRRGIIECEDSLMPVSAAKGGDFVCMLLDSYETADAAGSDYEVSEDGPDIVNKKSVKIVFTDKNGGTVLPEIPLDLSIYSAVDVLDDRHIAAVRNNVIDVFEYNGGWTKSGRLAIDAAAEKMRAADIDGDGTAEYVISDGVNIYVYTGTDRLKLAWRTKFGVSTVKDFFIADLNGDGVKEIYVNDSNGFAVRYVLGAGGFEVCGGGITDGENAYYAAGDIDGDGADDHLSVSEEEMKINK